jgi:hypothetical protein
LPDDRCFQGNRLIPAAKIPVFLGKGREVLPNYAKVSPNSPADLPKSLAWLAQVTATWPIPPPVLSKTSDESPKTFNELPKVPDALTKTPDELPKTSRQLPKTSADLPKTSNELPKTPNDLPNTSARLVGVARSPAGDRQ